jgi:hypothetical protein
MSDPGSSKTQVVRQGLEKACRAFTVEAERMGFARTKKMFWARRTRYTAEFVHFHREGSSYGGAINHSCSIRIHLGIRVLNDLLPGPALNGPQSDDSRYWGDPRYHLRFNAKSGSQFDRCAADLGRFLKEVGIPWFERYQDPQVLLSENSPLEVSAKERLLASLDERTDDSAVQASLRMLGFKSSP